MTKPFGFEKPVGMRDTLPELYESKGRLRDQIEGKMKQWGYRFVETPALEYYDTVGTATSIGERKLFKLLDQEGKTLVLRPDMTAPIARMVASGLKKKTFPLRLAYDASVFRAQQREGGHPAEFEQVGVELIGEHSIHADAEVIALLARILNGTGLQNFQVAVGHIGFVTELFNEILDEEEAEALRRLLHDKNYVGFRRFVEDEELSKAARSRLLALLDLRGGREKIEEAAGLIEDQKGKQMLAELIMLFEILDDYGVSSHIKVDFTLVSHMSYYTGIVFEGFNGKIGFPLASGGRYDELLGKFNREAPATGFAVFFDRLLEAIGPLDDEEDSCCIVYSDQWRKEAFDLAREKRADGVSVVLQALTGLKHVDQFTDSFQEVIYYTDKETLS